MIKILTILGARPQFIKAATVSRQIEHTPGLKEVLLHTGQHFDHDMSEVFFEEMRIPKPAYNLGINSMNHGAMTGRMLEEIEKIILIEKPDWVLVYGDTNSTLSGALAASKLHVKVAHVEAGLRSYNMRMPEEINRILTDRLSRMLFCPSQTAANNLYQEGYRQIKDTAKPEEAPEIILCGDVMLDACLAFRNISKEPEKIKLPADFVLATVHRAENTDTAEKLQQIVRGLNIMAESLPVVFPVHPRTQKVLQNNHSKMLSDNIILLPPQGYLNMLYLLEHCQMVATDSGGLQKEAYFFQKPCITLREETEWTELVEAGQNAICGTNPEKIIVAFRHFLKNSRSFPQGLYGNGKAAEKIVESLVVSS